MPLYIKTASVFCGRIIRKEDAGFQSMASEMTSYYADKKPGATEVLEGGLYAVQEDGVFHRSDMKSKYSFRGWSHSSLRHLKPKCFSSS